MPAEPEGRSLAGAHLGTVAGPGALAWNPAGLAQTPSPALLLSHATWMAETSWEWGAVTLPLASGGNALGISVGALRAGTLEQYDSEGTLLGEFAPVLTSAVVGYGASLSPQLRLGVCAEGILERSGTGEERSAWAGGLGLQWDAGRLSFGLSGLHLAPDAAVGDSRYPLPMTLRAGATLRSGGSIRLHTAAEWVAGEAARLIAGWEWQPVWGLRALTGLLYDPSASEETLRPTYGLACAVGSIAVAYGYQPSYWLEASHQISLSFGFTPRM